MEYNFDVMLHRTIRQGNEFDKLIPKHQNTRIDFETSAAQKLKTDTFDTLIFMNQWVDKYYGQLAKVAPLLKGKNTAETVDNIYKWLYNHFQYKLDTSPLKQQLYSPSAAWHYRSTGIDCKSFSILAAVLCKLLKINCSFRMVKQKGLKSKLNPNEWIVNPDAWSHVYVVVPDGNKTLIIDATTHNNREVEIVTKYDHQIMIHQGLNGAYTGQRNMTLGCACSGTSTQKHGLGNPNTLGFAITNFHKYLNELERKGVSRAVTNNMLGMVRYNVERGIDPNIDEILLKATAQKGQLGSIVGDLINNGVGQVTGGLSNISVGGVQVSDVAALAMGDPTAVLSIAKGVLSKIIPTNFISGTFGAVFSNGFDLSCWRATFPGNEVKERIQNELVPHFNSLTKMLQESKTIDEMEQRFNRLAKDAYGVQAVGRGLMNATDWSGCSRKGIQFFITFGETMMASVDKMKDELTAKGWTAKNITTTEQGVKRIGTEGHIFHDPHTIQWFYPVLTKPVIIPQPVQSPANGQPQSGQNPANGQPQNGATPPPKKEGINPLILLSVAGLAAKLLL